MKNMKFGEKSKYIVKEWENDVHGMRSMREQRRKGKRDKLLRNGRNRY